MIKVGIVGATGLVGQTIVKVLKEENLLSVIDLTFFASDKNYGKIISYYGKEFRLINLSEKIKQQKFDVVFFSAGDEISRQWVHVFEENGAYVIDNTNAFRKEELVPLIVPEINAEKITKNSKIIANPNCSTIQLAVVLDRLLKVSAISNIVVSTYQSVSGAGSKAVSDLKNKTNKVISAGIYDNVIAQIGSFDKCGITTEENKIMFETNKILDADISVVATAVRVPVSFCHTESVYVKFKNKIEMSKIQNTLKQEHIVFDENRVFVPTDVVGSNKTFVFRLRQISETEIVFVIIADNLRRGSAFNAVQIFKHLLNEKFIKY